MQRILVFGTTGSGKSTLAREVGSRLSIPYFEMDALNWNPGWVTTPAEDFRRKVDAATIGPQWITEGQYTQVRDIYLPRADTAIWLDYPFPLVFARLLKRTLTRIISQQTICNGNYETWQKTFLDKDSILLWAWKTHWSKRARYPELWRQNPHLEVLRFSSPRQTQNWLDSLQ